VTLDGSKSSDPDGDALSYKWEQTADLRSPSLAPSPPSPALPPAGANTLTFKLTVSDGSLTGSDSVKIAVVKPEHAPVAEPRIRSKSALERKCDP